MSFTYMDTGWAERRRRRLEKYRPMADAAKARFDAEPDAKFALHVHHEELGEALEYGGGVEAAHARIEYVLDDKEEEQLETRLRLIRPIPNSELPTRDAEALQKAHEEASEAYNNVSSTFIKARDALSDARSALHDAFYSFGDNYSTATVEGLETLKTAGDAVLAAQEVFDPLKEAYNAAGAARSEASAALNTEAPTREQFRVIHARICEPDCPWSEEQGTIFPN